MYTFKQCKHFHEHCNIKLHLRLAFYLVACGETKVIECDGKISGIGKIKFRVKAHALQFFFGELVGNNFHIKILNTIRCIYVHLGNQITCYYIYSTEIQRFTGNGRCIGGINSWSLNQVINSIFQHYSVFAINIGYYAFIVNCIAINNSTKFCH